jgi:membrane-bound ClpP family serine protease
VLVFLVLGGFGLALLVIGLIVGDLLSLDGLLDMGPVTTPVIGAALAAFGLGGALALNALGTGLAVVVGTGCAAVLGGATIVATKALLGQPVEPVRTSALLGVFGTVITRIPDSGLGEVVLPLGGHRVKLSARSHEPVPINTPVYVVEVVSETCVVVQRADLFDLKELT